ncbi:MAG: ABC transporter ATP-binding protein, partial [Pedobacter agri]
THVGIINKGQLLFQGTIDELHLLSKPMVEIEVDQTEEAAKFLASAGYEITSKSEIKITTPFSSSTESGKINTLLIKNGFTVSSLSKQRKDLENLFLDITKNN